MIRAPLPLLLGAALVACRPTQAPAPLEGSASAPSAEGSEVAAAPATLAGATRPGWDGPQPCETAADCRVFQPGDWSARVECCYEYGCDLDYVAVNQATLAAQRAWQAENRFDCAAHLRESGPCASQVPRCGLSQAPPEAICREGTCAVAWPDPWPAVDPDAQTCAVDADCAPFRPASLSPLGRCCGGDCRPEHVAVNRATLDALQRWRTERAESCEVALGGQPCPPVETCAVPTPPARCAAGLCRIADAAP